MAALDTILNLPVLDTTEHTRPEHARGPRSLDSLRLLRISVTDRCNLRCMYCMPEEGMTFVPVDRLLTPGEIESTARVARKLGVTHVKITGGEPTVRRDLLDIVAALDSVGFEDLSMTTNGIHLRRLAAPLRDAGLDRITFSIDSLRPDRYRDITGGGRLDLVHDGLDAAVEAGFERIKVNMVVMPGVNDDEVVDFAALARDRPWTIRYIEYMPLGSSRVRCSGSDIDLGVDCLENEVVRERIEGTFGELHPIERSREAGVGPADVFTMSDGAGRIGFISAMSRPFCEQCNRLRLTAVGELRACLFDGGEIDLRERLRPVVDEHALVRAFESCVGMKPVTHGAWGNRQMSQLGG